MWAHSAHAPHTWGGTSIEQMTQVLEAASAQKCRPPIDLSCSIGVLLRSNIVSDLSRKSWLSRLSPAHTATADELDQNFRTCTRIHCRTDHGPIIWTVAEQPGIHRQAGCTKQYVLLLVLANSGSCCLCQCLRRCPCTALLQMVRRAFRTWDGRVLVESTGTFGALRTLVRYIGPYS